MNVTDEPSGTDRFVNNNHPRRHSNDNCARSNINSDIFHRRRRPKSNNNYENNTENNHMRDHRHASSSLPSLTARDIHLIAYIVPKTVLYDPSSNIVLNVISTIHLEWDIGEKVRH